MERKLVVLYSILTHTLINSNDKISFCAKREKHYFLCTYYTTYCRENVFLYHSIFSNSTLNFFGSSTTIMNLQGHVGILNSLNMFILLHEYIQCCSILFIVTQKNVTTYLIIRASEISALHFPIGKMTSGVNKSPFGIYYYLLSTF